MTSLLFIPNVVPRPNRRNSTAPTIKFRSLRPPWFLLSFKNISGVNRDSFRIKKKFCSEVTKLFSSYKSLLPTDTCSLHNQRRQGGTASTGTMLIHSTKPKSRTSDRSPVHFSLCTYSTLVSLSNSKTKSH